MRPRRMVRSSVTSNSDRPMVGKKQWRTKNASVGRRPGLNDRLCDGRAICEWNERRAQSPALPGTARMLMLRGKRRNLIWGTRSMSESVLDRSRSSVRHQWAQGTR